MFHLRLESHDADTSRVGGAVAESARLRKVLVLATAMAPPRVRHVNRPRGIEESRVSGSQDSQARAHEAANRVDGIMRS